MRPDARFWVPAPLGGTDGTSLLLGSVFVSGLVVASAGGLD